MFEYSFVDLDSTIYETHRLAQAMRETFLNHGVTKEDFEVSLKRAVHGEQGDHYDYTFESQVANLRGLGYALSDAVVDELYSLFNVDYQADDAEKFLKFLKKTSEKTVLLSAGNSGFQKQKLFSSKLNNFFDEIHIVHGNKHELVRQRSGDGHSLFVNDSLKENSIISKMFPNILVVSRVNPRKDIMEYKQSGLPYFKTLIEIADYVSKVR